MAWPGRGQGHGCGGQFGGGFNHYLENPFILFPDDVVLPEPQHVSEKDPLINKKLKLQCYFEAPLYYIKVKGKSDEEEKKEGEDERTTSKEEHEEESDDEFLL